MGGMDFRSDAKGKNAKEAFSAAVDQARYEHGHGGYTGTIAEKHEFKMMTVPAGKTAEDFIDDLAQDFGEGAPKYKGFNPFHDKWGPAGCIDLGGGEFVFFGCASS